VRQKVRKLRQNVWSATNNNLFVCGVIQCGAGYFLGASTSACRTYHLDFDILQINLAG
jgi:hypothetical protein